MRRTKEISTNRFILPLLFILFSLLLEVVDFLWLGFKNSSGGLQVFPTAWMFNLGAILVIAGLIYIVANKHAMLVIFYLFLTLQIVLNIVNANIFNVFGDIFTLDYLLLGTEAVAAIRIEFIDFWSILLYVGILAVIITITVVLYKKNKKTVTLRFVSKGALAVALLILSEACGATLITLQYKSIQAAQAETIENNQSYLWDSLQFKLDAYKNFGFYGFYSKNIYDYLKGRDPLEYGEDVELLNYIEEGKVATNPNAILKDDNIIFILCESMDNFAYDPIYTPNVWRLMNGGACYFSNFYANNKTNISEGIALVGNMPKDYTLDTLVTKYGYDYPYTMPKIFKSAHKDEQVVTTYFHSYQRQFYHRDVDYTEKGYGFDKFYGIEDYKEQCDWFGDWVSDEDFFKQFADEFIPAEGKFFTHFASMSTHGPYTYENPRFKDLYAYYDAHFEEYQAWFDEYYKKLNYSIPTGSDRELFRRYKTATLDFDNMIGAMLEELENKGELDNTTIVLYADHNCYYDNMTYKVKNLNKADYSNTEAHHVPLIIYNSKLESGEYTQFCNTYDIFPTIATLHGLEFNNNLTQGYNLFSNDIENSFFGSHKGGMFDRLFYSNNIADIVPIKEVYTEEDVRAFKVKAERYYQRQEKIDLIYMYNLTKGIKI